jgi:hypothetical protein
VSCRAVAASELSAEAYIAGRLGLRGYDPVPFLDGAYLDETIELMDKVGRAAIGGNRTTMPTLLSLGVSSRAARLKGFEILNRGEIGFEELLDLIAQNNIDDSISRSLTPRYGWLYYWLCRRPRSWIPEAAAGGENAAGGFPVSPGTSRKDNFEGWIKSCLSFYDESQIRGPLMPLRGTSSNRSSRLLLVLNLPCSRRFHCRKLNPASK